MKRVRSVGSGGAPKPTASPPRGPFAARTTTPLRTKSPRKPRTTAAAAGQAAKAPGRARGDKAAAVAAATAVAWDLERASSPTTSTGSPASPQPASPRSGVFASPPPAYADKEQEGPSPPASSDGVAAPDPPRNDPTPPASAECDAYAASATPATSPDSSSKQMFAEAFSSQQSLAQMVVADSVARGADDSATGEWDVATELEQARTSLAVLHDSHTALKRQLSSVELYTRSFRGLTQIRRKSMCLQRLTHEQRHVEYRLESLSDMVATMQNAPASPTVAGDAAMDVPALRSTLAALQEANRALQDQMDRREGEIKRLTAEHAAEEARHQEQVKQLISASRENMAALQQANGALRMQMRLAGTQSGSGSLAGLGRRQISQPTHDLDSSWGSMATVHALQSTATATSPLADTTTTQTAFLETIGSSTVRSMRIDVPISPTRPSDMEGTAGGDTARRLRATEVQLDQALADGSANEDTYRKRTAELVAERDTAVAAREHAEELRADLEQKVIALETRVAAAEADAASAAAAHDERVAGLVEETAVQQRRCDNITAEHNALLVRVEALAQAAKAHAAEADAAHASNAGLRRENEHLADALKELRAELSDVQRSHSELQTAYSELEEVARTSHGGDIPMQGEGAPRRQLFLEAFTSNCELVTRLADDAPDAEASVELELARDTVQSMRVETASLAAQVTQLKSERDTARQAENDARGRHEAEIGALKLELAAMHDTNARLTVSVEAAERSRRTFEADAAAKAEECEALTVQTVRLSRELGTAEAARVELSGEVAKTAAALGKSHTTLRVKERELEELWGVKEGVERGLAEEREVRRQDVAQAHRELEAAETELRETRNSVGALYAALAEANAQLQAHICTSQDLEEELVTLRAVLAEGREGSRSPSWQAE